MQKIISPFLLLIFISFVSCSSISPEKETYERNTIKNLAADSTKNANEFLLRYDYQKALDYFTEALKNNIMIDNTSGIIKSYTDIGRVYMLIKNFDLSLEYFNKALIVAEQEKTYDAEKAYVLNALGEAYYFLKNYEKSNEYFIKALKIENNHKNIENQAIIIQNMAKIDRSEGNNEMALKRLLEVAKLFEILKDKGVLQNIKSLSLVYYSIGQTYSKLNSYNKAIEYIKKALDLDKFIENPSGIADDYYALGMLTEKKDRDYEKAITYFTRSKNIYSILNDVTQYIELSNKLAEFYYKIKNYKEYYINKINAFKNSKSDQKIFLAKEISEMLKTIKNHNYLTEDELLEITQFSR